MHGAYVVHVERSHQHAADCFLSRFRVAALEIRRISRLRPNSAPTLKIAHKRVLCFLNMLFSKYIFFIFFINY